MTIRFDLTPHFTIRVWGVPCSVPEWWDAACPMMFGRKTPHPVSELCEIEIDQTEPYGDLTISGHRGLETVNQKMLTRGSDVLPD